MLLLLLLPISLQGLGLLVDEWLFHRKRGLPRWERLGHPLDTLTAAACYAWMLWVPAGSPHALRGYVALCAFSCLFITKDEFVHKERCEGAEIWLHAVLFVLHPIVFLSLALVWRSEEAPWVVTGALAATLLFALYQLAYWNWLPRSVRTNLAER